MVLVARLRATAAMWREIIPAVLKGRPAAAFLVSVVKKVTPRGSYTVTDREQREFCNTPSTQPRIRLLRLRIDVNPWAVRYREE
jgi:hypothetical protein